MSSLLVPTGVEEPALGRTSPRQAFTPAALLGKQLQAGVGEMTLQAPSNDPLTSHLAHLAPA